MTIMKALSVVFYAMICLISLAAADDATAKCRMNFEPLKKAKWIKSTLNCTNFQSNNETSIIPYKPDCCQIVKSLFTTALARHLSDTQHFFLHNITTSKSCVQEFQSKVLTSLGFPQHLVSSCTVDPSHFAASPHHCAGIKTLDDLHAKINPVRDRLDGNALINFYTFEDYCDGNIYETHDCFMCRARAQYFQDVLDTAIGDESNYHDPYTPRCSQLLRDLYLARLNGPESYGAASCIFNLFETPNHSVILLTVVCVEIIIGLIILCTEDVNRVIKNKGKNSKAESTAAK
jgi:hypothetical protein